MAGFLDGGPLNVRIRIAFGATVTDNPNTWAWTDVTAWWHVPDPVEIAWGRSPDAEQAETATMRLTLKNTGGQFTPFDPRSPNWPHVVSWTPITYDIDLGDGIWRNRFSGFVRRWPVGWPAGSSKTALAVINCVGVLGRIGRGKPPTRSPMRRTLLASRPVAYYPFEDGGDATQGASALPGHPPATVHGTVEFEQVKDPFYTAGGQQNYGTLPLPNLNKGGSLSVVLPAEAVTAISNQWAIQVTAEVDLNTANTDIVLLDWLTPGGTYVRWQLWLQYSGSDTFLTAYTAAGPQPHLVTEIGAVASFASHRVTAEQVGTNIVVKYFESLDAPRAEVTVPGTLAPPTSITTNTVRATSTARMLFGHLVVWPTADPSVPMQHTIDSYNQIVLRTERAFEFEAAHLRLARLCAEDGVRTTMPAVALNDDVTRLGRQAAGTAIELYQQCETTDLGLLFEEGFGLGYLPRASRYNRPVAITIDAAQRQLGMPFTPVEEDPQQRNVWTVTRAGGSSAVAADRDAVARQGEIEGSATIMVSNDAVLADHAEWRLRQTSVKEPRYSEVSIDLGAHRELAAAWASCRPGSRIQVINPPPQNPPGVVDQLIVGGRETFRGRRSWKASMNVVPARPWNVAQADGEQRVPSDSTNLTTAFVVGAGSFTASGDSDWVTGNTSTNPTDFPMEVTVGAERVRVSAISGTGAQVFTVQARGLDGWTTAHPAGTPVDVADPAIVAL